MAPRTATSFIGIVPWQGLLLTASLLTFWSPPTTAQPVVQAIPPNVVEGENVLLQLIHAATNHWGYKWYRGTIVASDMMIATFSKVSEQNTTGNAYTGQEIIYSNGSLLIRNITRENATNYIVEVILDDLIVLQASGEFRVYSPVSQPSISTSSGTLTEDDSVVLDCHSRDTGITFSWLFEKQKLRLNKRMSLSTIGNSLTISPVKPWDAGEYQCEVSNPAISKRSESLFLSVTGPFSTMAASRDQPFSKAKCLDIEVTATMKFYDSNLIEAAFTLQVDEIAYSSLNFNNLQPKQSTSHSLVSTVSEIVYSEVKKK
nr:carcinoembryonic antigen-related cell adhesion molecule 21-like [Cavia porcellus]